MRVALNTFVSFVSVSGLAKVNKVAEAKREYHVQHDFYKKLRDRVIAALSKGDMTKVQQLPRIVKDDRKVSNYAACIEGLEKWMDKTTFSVVGVVAPAYWIHGELQISVNPELLIRVDGEAFAVKLYMGKDRLSRAALQTYGYLVATSHKELRDAMPAILDLRRSRLIPVPASTRRVRQLVEGEAAAFITMWNIAA
jgi:hypothetical protein